MQCISLYIYNIPVNKCGNFIGNITASFNDSLASWRPATSDHFTFGVSTTIAPENHCTPFNKPTLIFKTIIRQYDRKFTKQCLFEHFIS